VRNVSRAALLVALLFVIGATAGAAPSPGAPAAAKKPAPAPLAKASTAPASGASLLVPAIPDTLPPDSDAAPFLVPGRPIAVDSTRTREARAQVYLAMAEDMERRGQLSTALAAYEGVLALDTTLTGIAFRMGRIYQTLDDPERAARAFARELKRDPRNAEAALELGISLAQMGREADAIARLEALTKKDPRDDRAWSALGFAYHAAGRTREAETAMRRALELPPGRAAEHRDLGALLASQGRDREARAEFQKAMAMDPKDAAAWINLGNLERRAGRNEQALAAYRAAEARDSSQALALQGEAQTLAAMGRAREAEAAYRRWIERRPSDFGARLEAIHFFVSEGRSDVALEIARGAVRIDPNSGDAHLMLGVALDAAGDKRGALAELRRAEVLAADEAGRARARQLVVTLRAGAPDSLRALFAADSVKYEGSGR
jgi:tetratricopeptide (TPR) repeat protein